MLITKTIKHTNDEPYMEVHAEIPLRTIKEVLGFCCGTKYTCHAVMNLIKNVPMEGPKPFSYFANAYQDEYDFCYDFCYDYVAELSKQVVDQMIVYLEQIYGQSRDHLVLYSENNSVQFKDWVDRMEIITEILEYMPDAALVLNIKTSINDYN